MRIKQLSMSRRTGLGNQRGATLLEAIAYLGIAGIIIVGAVSLLTRAFSGASSQRTIEQIEAIAVNIKKQYSSQTNYQTLSNPNLYNVGGFPSTLRISAPGGVLASVQNAWGGNVTVAGAAGPLGVANSAFRITYAGLPRDACIELVTSLTANHWSSAGQGANNFTNFAANEGAFPVTPTTASTNCLVAGNNTVNIISKN